MLSDSWYVYGVVAVVVLFSAFFGWSASQPSCGSPSSMTVRGDSMQPILRSGQNITVSTGYYTCRDVSVGDIVVMNWSGNDAPIVKTVKAVPGDMLRVEGCQVYRDGDPVRLWNATPYCLDGQAQDMLSIYEGNASGYLLLGTNPSGGVDSTRFGLVGRRQVMGRVVDKDI